MPFDLLTGAFIPERSNIWRDACDGYIDWVREHVEAGATINDPDLCGDAPLVLAAGNGHVAVVKYLVIEEGANLEQKSVTGETPLIRAAHNGHLETIRVLLVEGADVHAVDRGLNTALHWAAMRGHVECVQVLLAAGADRTRRNAQQRMPIDLCQPQWSPAWRYCKSALSAEQRPLIKA